MRLLNSLALHGRPYSPVWSWRIRLLLEPLSAAVQISTGAVICLVYGGDDFLRQAREGTASF